MVLSRLLLHLLLGGTQELRYDGGTSGPRVVRRGERGGTSFLATLAGSERKTSSVIDCVPCCDCSRDPAANTATTNSFLLTHHTMASLASNVKHVATMPERLNFAEQERKTLQFWKDIDAFKTSLELNKDKPLYTFYDGPPFATGKPHYGHILAGTIKDTVTRWAHQTGHNVERRFGWDCHGVPVEFEIDKKLNIKGKEDVEKLGIRKYNDECRSIVSRYCGEWEIMVNRLGRWIDMENDYKTMEPWYMESVWWVFQSIWKKDLVYKGYKVMPYSTVLNSPLSNFEASQNYKDVNDPAVVVTLPLVDDPDVAFLAWTTTPWTLPSNLALCVNPDMVYVKYKDIATEKHYIVMEARMSEMYPGVKKGKKYKGGEFEIVQKYKGSELQGIRYVPLFDYFADRAETGSFQVCVDAYVGDDAGTGVVHQAPAFGEDDYRVCMAHGVIQKGEEIPCPLDANGKFTDECPDLVGQHVKASDEGICATLKARGRLVKKSAILHSYPFCWRSDTPLIYRVIPAWFINVTAIKDDLVKNNTDGTYWVPRSVKEGRFHNWISNARDWCVSRNRYWGTPIPIWVSDDGEEQVCVGSIAELEELTGTKITDIHRENIDDLTIPSKQGKGVLRRIPEVLDCWFESGSMPYAQQHYPFENKEKFESGFPADFIAEGLDQTRGWFYTLMVLSTALFNKPAFKNLVCNGLVLAEDGKKMSKRLKNYPDPSILVDEHGADALRLYLINSPVVRAEELKFREAGVKAVVRDLFLPWYNSFRFLFQNVTRLQNTTGATFIPTTDEAKSSTNVMDFWIQASLHNMVKYVHEEMAAYRLYNVVPALVSYLEELTKWYVRMNRSRLKGAEGPEDTKKALSTLYEVLLTLSRIMSPFTPFFAEYTYQELRILGGIGTEQLTTKTLDPTASVHYENVPAFDESRLNSEIAMQVSVLQETIDLGRIVRAAKNISMKMPLKQVIIVSRAKTKVDAINKLQNYVIDELNCMDVVATTDEVKWCQFKAVPDNKILGKKLGKKFGAAKKEIAKLTHEQIVAFEEDGRIELAGCEIVAGELLIQRTLSDTCDKTVYESKPTKLGDMLVIIDTRSDEAMFQTYLAREVVNRVQKLRKTLGLLVGDRVNVFYTIGDDDASKAVVTALTNNSELVTDILRTSMTLATSLPDGAEELGNEEFKINDGKIKLTLTKPCATVADVTAGVGSM